MVEHVEIVSARGVPSVGREGDERDREARVQALYESVEVFLNDKPENTRRTYRTALRQFFRVVGKEPALVSDVDAVNYKRWLVEDQKYKKNTICTRLAALDSFFTFLVNRKGSDGRALAQNPFDVVSRKDVRPTPFATAVTVDGSDFKKMLAAVPTDAIGLRDRAVLIFLAWTGRRRAEVARLRMGDLHLSTAPGERRLYTVTVKGGQEKRFDLPDEAYEAMREHWTSSGRLQWMRTTSPVFGQVGARADVDQPLEQRTIWVIVKRAAVRAGLDATKIKTHGLRHMFARDLDRAGMRLQDIKESLGHASADTTMGYLGALRDPPSLAESLRRVRQ